MTSDVKLLDEKVELRGANAKIVHLPNGDITHVTHIGTCKILDTGQLKNALFISDFKFDLLSVSKITKKLKCLVLFFPDFVIFQDLYNGVVKGIGRDQDGLYLLLRNPTKGDMH